MLLSSYAGGLFEIEPGRDNGWVLARRHRSGAEVPAGHYGPASYGPEGEIHTLLYSRGLVTLGPSGSTLSGIEQGLGSRHLANLLALRSGELWLSHLPSPVRSPTAPALELWDGRTVAHSLPLHSKELTTVGDWIELEEPGVVWAATRAGVVEIRGGGELLQRSTGSAVAIDRRGERVVAAGATILSWTKETQRFVPILFQAQHPRRRPNSYAPGPVLDVALDDNGGLFLLHRGGVVLYLDPEGVFTGVLDDEDGIPSSARKLLFHPGTASLLVGSTLEGLVELHLARPVDDEDP